MGRRQLADYSNPFLSQLVGECFGQKGRPGPQGPNRESGPLLDLEGDPITIWPFLKGKKGPWVQLKPKHPSYGGPDGNFKGGKFSS